MLESSEKYAEATRDLGQHGVIVGDVKLDLAAMHRRRERIVKALAGGVDMLLEQNGVTRLPGRGRLVAACVGEGLFDQALLESLQQWSGTQLDAGAVSKVRFALEVLEDAELVDYRPVDRVECER